MKVGQKFTICAFRARWVRKEEMAFHCWERNDFECSLPGVEQKIKRTADVFPVSEMKESVLKSES
jgi:hypothetical protein